MFWKNLIILFCVTFVPSYAMIVCHYDFDENDLYTCNMLIFNPSGDSINVITGNHLPNHTHDDVIHINSMGLSLNVPSIICSTFQNLEKMELDDLGIITLANNPFENCGSLKELSLNKNDLRALYPNLFTNTVLEELYLEDNAFNEVTAEQLTDLDNLKTLSFKGNGQTSFTGSVFEHLPNLEYLDLSACNFTEIKTEWFANGLSKLQVLNLADNFLEEIPANTFNALTVLEILALDNNQISTLNEDSFELPALKALFLDANKLDDLQANVFRHLARLEILYLSENDCSNLPGNIFSSIPTLTTLAMHACFIETIKPEWFQTIPNLSILLLEENNIKEFPERTFQSTNNLKFLSVYGNQLTELNSRSFGSAVSLTHLDVRSNQINGIEHHLMDLMNVIRVVLLSENLCANFDTLSYDLRSDEYKERLKSCFDNFDNTPIVLETDNTASFEWYTIRTNDRWTFIEFNVTAPGYVHIALTDSPNDALLEIRVGEESNTQLQIFERGEKKITRNESDLLNGIFKINLGLSFITFYKNSSQIPFYGYFIENYFSVNFFGLRTQIPPTGSINKISWEVQRIQS